MCRYLGAPTRPSKAAAPGACRTLISSVMKELGDALLCVAAVAGVLLVALRYKKVP